MNPKPQREGEKKIEEILRNRILYIGNEIPEFFTKDKRDKQLYLGYPQQLIDELSKELSSLIREEYERGWNDAVISKNNTITILMKELREERRKIIEQLKMTILFNEKATLDDKIVDWGWTLRAFIENLEKK